MEHSFAEKLTFSLGDSADTDIRILESMIEGATKIERGNKTQDMMGWDYIVTLRGVGTIIVDAKTREAGCRKHWIDGPELALEVWSVKPDGNHKGKAGWTLNENSDTDMILFKFDPSDCEQVFLYPFQPLRMAFRRNLSAWRKRYKVDVQSSGSWKSECIFVPEWVVWRAVSETRFAQLVDTPEIEY